MVVTSSLHRRCLVMALSPPRHFIVLASLHRKPQFTNTKEIIVYIFAVLSTGSVLFNILARPIKLVLTKAFHLGGPYEP